jgi:predicted Zn-dependent peptidase
MLETNEGIGEFLLAAEQFGLGLDHDRRLPGLLRDVTLEDVHEAAAELLDPSRASIVVAGPSENGRW